MTLIKTLKNLSIMAILSLAVVACSSTQEAEDTVTEVMATEAIAAAAASIALGNEIGADTSAAQSYLDQANAALAEGDYTRAFELANQAKAEADAALAARQAELAASEVPEVESASSSYQVVGGDSLWSIAGSSAGYGDPYQWPLIYKANKAQIKDADLIFPGQVFDIVSGLASEVEAAIQHAKTRGAWSVGSAEASDSAYLAQ